MRNATPRRTRLAELVPPALEVPPLAQLARLPPPEPAVPSPNRWMSIRSCAHEYRQVITEAALRHLVWQAEAYAKSPSLGLKCNGFLAVIIRPPGQRKVLLDRVEFEKWLVSGRKHRSGGPT